VLIIKKNAFF